jgi:single-strand DNA-binding protein
MSSYISNLTIVGNLGRDPEMRYTPSGQPVTNFSVAINRQYTNGNGQPVKDVIWFRVSAWGKQAEVCSQFLKKGAKVLVEGRLEYDAQTGGPKIWEGQDGSAHADFGLVAQIVRFLSPKDGNGDHDAALTGDADVENIPF